MKTQVAALDTAKINKAAIVFAGEKAKLLPNAAGLDKSLKGGIAAALKNSRFQGGSAEMFVATAPIGNLDRVFVCGTGKSGKDTKDWFLRGLAVGRALDRSGIAEATLVMEKAKPSAIEAAESFLEGVNMSLYRFELFRTNLKPHQKACFKKLTVQMPRGEEATLKKRLPGLEGLMDGLSLSRDLVNLPPNVANPDHMAATARDLAKLGLKVEILGEKELAKLNMNLMLAVGHGAKQESRLLVIRHEGAAKKDPWHALVGKGVMFDTGGYDIKPADGMLHMKADMAGAAAVLGTMKALALRKTPLNVVGVCGCVMNMISGDAYLPSDIIKGHKGLTVEVGNTDAEGRLVLADALSYIIDKQKPVEVVDIATLTGACMIALGACYAGLFSNNDKMAGGLLRAGRKTGEELWRLPVGPEYGRQLKSKVADLSNIGPRWGGACTAAAFLQKFVGKTHWAHLDIAGVGMTEKIPGNLPVSGASGFGVRLLVNYLEAQAS